MDQLLIESEYTDPSKPGAYSGQTSFFRELKKRYNNVDEQQVKRVLSNKESYTLHRPIRKRFQRNRVIVSGIDDTFQIDLVDMSSLSKVNDNQKFILTCIDVFSKYAWAIAIKNKSAESVVESIKDIFKIRVPQRIQTDEGKEFLNKQVKQLLTRYSVKLYVVNSEMKASIVERFNRTLKEKMWRYFTDKQTYRYVDRLDDFVSSYNNSFHRSIKTSPSQVNEENEKEIFFNLYGYDKEKGQNKEVKFKFNVGDLVRLSKSKSVFEKGYTAKWTRELFKIYECIPRIPPVYRVVDTHPKPEIIEGIFYEQELEKVANDDEIFFVERVLKTKTDKKGEKSEFVKWLGYPDKFNSWISARDIVNSFDDHDNIDLDKLENNNNRIEFSI